MIKFPFIRIFTGVCCLSSLCVRDLGGEPVPPVSVSLTKFDFSYVGRSNSAPASESLPTITLSPLVGDNSAQLSQAIQDLSARPLVGGFRGIIALNAGLYELEKTLSINADGIVLRGSCDPAKPTILVHQGKGGDAVIVVEPLRLPTSATAAAPELGFVIDPVVQNGAYEFQVDRPELFPVNARIVVTYPSTERRIAAINASENLRVPWSLGRVDERYYRVVVGRSDNRIKIDAPILDRFDREMAKAYVRVDREPLLQSVWIENITADASKCRTGVRLSRTTESLVRNIKVIGYTLCGIELTKNCTRIEIDQCDVGSPTLGLKSGQGYAFRVKASQLLLFRNCIATDARYSFICAGGSFDSGIAFVDCRSIRASVWGGGSIGHWAHAVLFDRFIDESPEAKFGLFMDNRGDTKDTKEGEGGWSLVRSVARHCRAIQEIRVKGPTEEPNIAEGCSSIKMGRIETQESSLTAQQLSRQP